MARFVVGTGGSTPATSHRLLSAVVARVNWLVNLGYQGILIRDQETSYQCIANDVTTQAQVAAALHTGEVSISHLLKRNEYQQRYRKDKKR